MSLPKTPKMTIIACNPMTHAQKGEPWNQSIAVIDLKVTDLNVLDIDYIE